MSASESEKKVPEWDIFKRIEEVEDITLELMEKADTTEPSLKDTSTRAKDASLLALYALGTGFMTIAADFPNPRALKDRYIDGLEQSGLSQRTLGIAKKVLTAMCELIEKARTSK